MNGVLAGGFLAAACHSDRGRLRPRNEDACSLPLPGADETGLGVLLALADGAGGLPGGAEASREAVQNLQAVYYAAAGPAHPAGRLRYAVEAVNALNRLAQRQPGPQNSHVTTLVAAVISAGEVWVANVGDSRAYLAQPDGRQIQQLTEDHSGHVRSVKAGLAGEADPAGASQSGISQSGSITRAIGLHDRCQVDTYHYTWSPGHRLLLCSDGLAGLAAGELAAVLLENEPEAAARELVLRAVQADGSDNCTAVVAAWLPSPAPQESRQATRLAWPQPARPPEPQPAPAAGPSSPPRRRLSRLPAFSGSLLFGLLLGWLSAALLFIFLLESRGIINLF